MGRLHATWYDELSRVVPIARPMAHVRMKPVMREMATHTLMRSCERPTRAWRSDSDSVSGETVLAGCSEARM